MAKVIKRMDSGWDVECLPVADQFLRVGSTESAPTEPTPPTYVVIDGPGDETTLFHDEESIKSPKTTEEAKAAWATYMQEREVYSVELDAYATRNALKQTRFVAVRGVRILNLPDLDVWAKDEEEFYGLPTPDNPREKKVEFFTRAVAQSQKDVQEIILGIFEASGMTEERLDQVEDMFLRQMGGSERSDAETDQEEVSPT